MTISELRNILFRIDNQNITVVELRQVLFTCNNLDNITPKLLEEINDKF